MTNVQILYWGRGISTNASMEELDRKRQIVNIGNNNGDDDYQHHHHHCLTATFHDGYEEGDTDDDN